MGGVCRACVRVCVCVFAGLPACVCVFVFNGNEKHDRLGTKETQQRNCYFSWRHPRFQDSVNPLSAGLRSAIQHKAPIENYTSIFYPSCACALALSFPSQINLLLAAGATFFSLLSQANNTTHHHAAATSTSSSQQQRCHQHRTAPTSAHCAHPAARATAPSSLVLCSCVQHIACSCGTGDDTHHLHTRRPNTRSSMRGLAGEAWAAS